MIDNYYNPLVDEKKDVSNILKNQTLRTESDIFKLYELSTYNTNELEIEVQNAEKTFLVIPEVEKLSRNLLFKFESYPQFFLSTALSASLHNQQRCLQDLEIGNVNYHQEGCYHYLGL